MENKNNYYPLKGKLYLKRDEVQVSDLFRKREFVLEVSSEWNGKIYTELITMELVQDAVEKLNTVKVGDEIEVMFALRGREYDKKDGTGKGYFNSVKATSIQTLVSVPSTPQSTSGNVVSSITNDFQEDPDLPF